MLRIVLFFATVLLVQCSPKLAPDAGWAGGRWVLTELNGVPVQVSGTEKDAHLVFSPADHKYSGSSGCNRLMGTYSLGDKSAISFGTPAGTRMTCMDQKFEDAFNKFFATVNHYSVDGKTMNLMNGSAVVMKLEKISN